MSVGVIKNSTVYHLTIRGVNRGLGLSSYLYAQAGNGLAPPGLRAGITASSSTSGSRKPAPPPTRRYEAVRT